MVLQITKSFKKEVISVILTYRQLQIVGKKVVHDKKIELKVISMINT